MRVEDQRLVSRCGAVADTGAARMQILIGVHVISVSLIGVFRIQNGSVSGTGNVCVYFP